MTVFIKHYPRVLILLYTHFCEVFFVTRVASASVQALYAFKTFQDEVALLLK